MNSWNHSVFLSRKLTFGLITAVLSLSTLHFLVSACLADNPKDFASWWIRNYGVVDSKSDPLAGRAEQVFGRVVAASDKKGNRLPRLVIVKADGDPYAQAIQDGSVILTQGGLKICYRGVDPDKADSRLAFVLGHELAHLSKDDFWHGLAFVALKEYGDESHVKESLLANLKWDVSDPRTQEFIRKQELQADSYGLIYMTMAGYDPKAVVDKDGTNFFEEWVSQITGKIAYSDSLHPGPQERADFLRSQLVLVTEALDYFTFGARLYQLGRYSDAILLLEAFNERFPGREVFNNIGLCYYQLSMEVLSACDESLPLRFKLSTILDLETLGSKLRNRGSESSSCLKDETFLKYINEGIRHFRIAVDMDPVYLPARVSLSSAFILSGEYANAMSVSDEALKIQPGNPEAMNNKAVALYLFGKVNNIDTADHAVGLLREASKTNPSFSDPAYNTASIQSERGRSAAASQEWMAFLSLEPAGIYARAASERLGVKTDEKFSKRKITDMKSPITLGKIKGETEKALKGMQRKMFSIGAFTGEIYEGNRLRALVIDGTVEVVEEELETRTTLREFRETHGDPAKLTTTTHGQALVYGNFGIDVVNGSIRKIFYFKRETI